MIIFPYRDDNPTRSFPIVNWLLILANIWVFFAWQLPLGVEEKAVYFSSFGFIPSTFFSQFSNFSFQNSAWEWSTIFTSMFSHGGIFHLLGNLLFLYLYGDNLEEALGKIWYLIFYLSCGILAAFAQALTNPESQIPMVGASGAISGVIGGYILLYPKANVRVFYWIIFFIGTLYIPAYIVLGFWLVQQVIAFPSSMESAGGVAIAAHLGGFISGFVLTPFLKKPNIKLFQSGNTKAFSRYR